MQRLCLIIIIIKIIVTSTMMNSFVLSTLLYFSRFYIGLHVLHVLH